MIRFLQIIYVFLIPHFATFYYLEFFEEHRRIVLVVRRPDVVQPCYRDRIFTVKAFVFLGKARFARFVRK